MNALGKLTHGAFDFRMTFVANHQKFVAFFGQLGDFHMHLGDQRASRIEDAEATALGLLLHGLADTMRRKNQRGARRDFVQLFNKDSASGLEVIDHKGVVHDLVAHIDGRAKLGQRPLHDLDGAIDPGAKAARLGQQNFFGAQHVRAPRSA